jgi:hypothetical protein
MSEIENTIEMKHDDRLKAILYQFIKLYERWAEDRQVAAKQGAELEELISLFSEQIEDFQSLESTVRDQIISSIENVSKNAVKSLGAEIGFEATKAVEHTAYQLYGSVDKAQRALNSYEHTVALSQWKTLFFTMATTIITSLLLVWLLIPAPMLPLTKNQINDLNQADWFNSAWPLLSKKEKKNFSANMCLKVRKITRFQVSNFRTDNLKR